MANKLQLKRSAVPGKIPATTDLDLGEIAINTYDGRVFIKKNVSGTESVVDITAAATPLVPSGTKMLFAQTAAPTGWTKDTTHNDKALRVVSGTAGSGGSVAFTTAFASQTVSGTIGDTTATNQATTAGGTVGNTTLTQNEMPIHTHTQDAHSHGITYGGAGYTTFQSGGGNEVAQTTGSRTYVFFSASIDKATATNQNAGASWAHGHSFAGSSHNHTQDAHNHSFTGTAIDMAVQYVDVIIATKD